MELIKEIEKNSQEKLRVSLEDYKGKEYVDMRVFVQIEGSEEWIPTKKGLTLRKETLEELREAIDEALKKFKE